MAVISPAIWAAKARGLARVSFVTLGAAGHPKWGSSIEAPTGFVVLIALAYFVALSRQRWGLSSPPSR